MSKKRIILVISLFAIVVISLIGATYSFFANIVVNGNNGTPTSITTPTLDINFTTTDCYNISNANLINDVDKATKASYCRFNVTLPVSSTIPTAYIKMFLSNISVSNNLISPYLKWEILEYNSSSYNEETVNVINTGNFNNFNNANHSFPLNTYTQQLTKNVPKYYAFRLWLSNDNSINQNDLMNGTISSRIKVEAYANPGYLQNNLIIHYDGHNNTGIGFSNTATNWYDVSGHNNHGYDFVNITWGNNCAVYNNSTSKIKIPSVINNVISQNGNFTLEMVANPNSVTDRDILIGNFDNSGINLEKNGSSYTDGRIRFYWNASPNYFFTNSLLTNQKHTISLVRNGSLISVYVDGLLKDQSSFSQTALASSVFEKQYYLGADTRNSSVTFGGNIYAFRAYNSALNDIQINQNYQNDNY